MSSVVGRLLLRAGCCVEAMVEWGYVFIAGPTVSECVNGLSRTGGFFVGWVW